MYSISSSFATFDDLKALKSPTFASQQPEGIRQNGQKSNRLCGASKYC
jgi:hypothetical protein